MGNTTKEIFSPGALQAELERHGSKTPLKDFLKKTWQEFAEMEMGPKFERDSTAQQLFMMFLGKVLIDQDSDGIWEEVELEDGEVYVNCPVWSAFVRMLAKEGTKSNPNFVFSANEGDVNETALARACNAFAEFYMKKFFTAEFEQGNVVETLFFGDSCFRVEWGKDDIAFEGINGFSWWSNSWAKDFSKTIWFREDDVVDWAQLKAEYPDCVLDGGTGFDEEHRSLRQQRAIERTQTGQASNGFMGLSTGTGYLHARERIRTREYFKPVVYAHYTTDEDETLPNGKTLKAGKKLIDEFPDGLCIVRCGDEILGMYNHDFHKSIVHVRYVVVPNRLHGKSIADSAEIQHVLNEVMSLIVTYGMEAGSPTMFYDESIVPDGIGALGKPSLRIPVGKRPIDMKLSEAIMVVQPGSLSPVVQQLPQELKENLQVVMGAFSPFGGGLPEAAGETATGMAISAEASSSQQALALELRAEAKAKLLQLALRCYADNAKEEKVVKLLGPYTEGQAMTLKASDFDYDIKVSVAKNSYWPRELYQQQAAQHSYYQALGSAAQSAMARGEELSLAERTSIAEMWLIDIAQNEAQISREIAKERLDKVLDFLTRLTAAREESNTGQPAGAEPLTPEEIQIIQQAEGVLLQERMQQAAEQAMAAAQVDPMSGAVMPGPQPDPAQIAETITPEEVYVKAADLLVPMKSVLDRHKEFGLYYKQWALTHVGRNAGPLLTAWVEMRTQMHMQMAQGESMAMQMAMQGGAPAGGASSAGGPQPAAPTNESAIPGGMPSLPLVTASRGPM